MEGSTIERSLLLLFLAFSAFLAFFGQEFAFCLEPLPACLDVTSGIVHGHLLADFGLLFVGFCGVDFVTLLAVLLVLLNLGREIAHLSQCQVLAIRDSLLLLVDASALSLTLRLLLLVLGAEQGYALLQVTLHGLVNIALS